VVCSREITKAFFLFNYGDFLPVLGFLLLFVLGIRVQEQAMGLVFLKEGG